MKITIEAETDAEKADPQIKRVVMTDLAALAMVGIPAEHPELTPMYVHYRGTPMVVPLQQRVSELAFQLTKARTVAELSQAQPTPRIQVPQANNVPFPGTSDRLRGG